MKAQPTFQPEIELAGNSGGVARNRPNAAKDLARHPLYITYFGMIVTVGAAVLIYSIYRTLTGNTGLSWMVFALFTMITAMFSLRMPKTDIRISVPDVFIFTSILLFGPAIGVVTAAVEGLTGSLRAKTKPVGMKCGSLSVKMSGAP